MITTNQSLVPQNNQTFTICALLYGNHMALAQRCLASICALPDYTRWELRVLTNEISDTTRGYLSALTTQWERRGLKITQYDSPKNIGKYPLMRKAFQDPERPLAKYTMWFDDDSYIKTPSKAWLDRLEQQMEDCDMCGQYMSALLSGGQPYWITAQPWYKGKRVVYGDFRNLRNVPKVPGFAVGGWWCARSSMLARLDWPTTNIIHRGGDYMLGEAMRQNDFKLKNYYNGVAINADFSDKDGASPRRGWDPVPVGVDYEPSLTAILHEATADIPPPLLDYTNL